MKELGSSTAYNTHNTTSLIRTLKYVSDILQMEEAFTVEEYKHTRTDPGFKIRLSVFNTVYAKYDTRPHLYFGKKKHNP